MSTKEHIQNTSPTHTHRTHTNASTPTLDLISVDDLRHVLRVRCQFLLNSLRDEFDFHGMAIRLQLGEPTRNVN